MEKFSYLSHTADVQLRIEGDSKEELFRAGLKGLNDLLKPGGCREKAAYPFEQSIELKSPDLTSLLIDFLSAILSITYSKKLIICEVDFPEFQNNYLQCTLKGKEENNFEEDVKAVTYHEAEVKKNRKGNWESLVIFDI